MLNLLNVIKSDTATGCDDIPGFLLKKIATAIALNISTVFNRSIEAGEFPTNVKESKCRSVQCGKGKAAEANR